MSTDKKMTEEQFAGKIEWEGGITDALDYGLRHTDLPEDSELGALWSDLESAYAHVEAAAEAVREYLDDNGLCE